MEKPDLNIPAFKISKEQGESIQQGKCPTCNAEIKEGEFKDNLSKKEFSISGMCQICQDKVFK